MPSHDDECNCTKADQRNQCTVSGRRLGWGRGRDGGCDGGRDYSCGCYGCNNNDRGRGYNYALKDVEQCCAGCILQNCLLGDKVLVGFECRGVDVEGDLVQAAVTLGDFNGAGCSAELAALALLGRLE